MDGEEEEEGEAYVATEWKSTVEARLLSAVDEEKD